jgi:hypothetical protein
MSATSGAEKAAAFSSLAHLAALEAELFSPRSDTKPIDAKKQVPFIEYLGRMFLSYIDVNFLPNLANKIKNIQTNPCEGQIIFI